MQPKLRELANAKPEKLTMIKPKEPTPDQIVKIVGQPPNLSR